MRPIATSTLMLRGRALVKWLWNTFRMNRIIRNAASNGSMARETKIEERWVLFEIVLFCNWITLHPPHPSHPALSPLTLLLGFGMPFEWIESFKRPPATALWHRNENQGEVSSVWSRFRFLLYPALSLTPCPLFSYSFAIVFQMS